MADELGRDKIWTPEVWQTIDQAVLEELSRIRVAQKVFPAVQIAGDAAPVDRASGVPLAIPAGASKPFLELSVRFSVTQGQVDQEGTLHNGRTLARLAATNLARAEDMVLFDGYNTPNTQTTNGMVLPASCTLTNPGADDTGILGAAALNQQVNAAARAGGKGAAAAAPGPTWGENLFGSVVAGIAQLEGQGHPGPFALMLQSTAYADAFNPVQGLTTTADRVTPLVQGGFYSSGSLPTIGGKPTGLLVSLGGEPTVLYFSKDAKTAYTHQDAAGLHQFRVFETIHFVVRDPNALVHLNFQ